MMHIQNEEVSESFSCILFCSFVLFVYFKENFHRKHFAQEKVEIFYCNVKPLSATRWRSCSHCFITARRLRV